MASRKQNILVGKISQYLEYPGQKCGAWSGQGQANEKVMMSTFNSHIAQRPRIVIVVLQELSLFNLQYYLISLKGILLLQTCIRQCFVAGQIYWILKQFD